jgi:hypothetical protein
LRVLQFVRKILLLHRFGRIDAAPEADASEALTPKRGEL